MVRRALKLLLWRATALVCLGLGLLGVLLPGLPTVPFVLLAAWAGGRGWPALEQWLLRHPRHGATLRQWREAGAVPRRAKWAASLMMAASALVMWALGVPTWALATAVLVMAAVAAWLWCRPEPCPARQRPSVQP
ncbi:MAG: DUF454 domain-containing protein [Leptothrix sp. (in: Bacteria)]|nr:DUF454 domain-containing protein [Leptothrix sp. (in: b-proteobacteria)]